MIEIKKPVTQTLQLNETIITLTGTELNVFPKVYSFAWTREIVIYVTILNSTNENFTSFNLLDINSDDLITPVVINSGGYYSVTFAGDAFGQPTTNTKIINLVGNLQLTWINAGTVTGGGVTIKIYSKNP